MKIWNILSPKTLLGTVLAALVAYIAIRSLIDPLWSKKKGVTKIHGSVLEKRENLNPVYNASVIFLNLREERTDTNGQFSTQLEGYGSDSITIEISLPEGLRFNQKFLVDYGKKEIFLSPFIFPVTMGAKIKEVSKEEFIHFQKKEAIPIYSDNTNKTQNTSNTISNIKQNPVPTEPIDTRNNNTLQQSTELKKEDVEIKLDGYINEVAAETDMAILIVDNNNQPVNSISSEIAKLYRNKGHFITNSLFTSKLLNSKYLNELMNSNSQLINALNLPLHLKYLVVGKYTKSFEASDGENVKVICRANLDVRVISCVSKSQIDGFEIPVSNGHNDRQHAEKGAIEKLMSDFSLNHLNL